MSLLPFPLHANSSPVLFDLIDETGIDISSLDAVASFISIRLRIDTLKRTSVTKLGPSVVHLINGEVVVLGLIDHHGILAPIVSPFFAVKDHRSFALTLAVLAIFSAVSRHVVGFPLAPALSFVFGPDSFEVFAGTVEVLSSVRS